MAQRMELGSGIAAGLLGTLGLAYAWSLPALASLAPLLCALALLVAAATFGAYLDGRHDLIAWLVLLVVATALLLPIVVVTASSLGLLLLPAALCALVASFAGGLAR